MAVRYQEAAPAAALAEWVECGWSVETDSAIAHRVTPDGCVDIIYDRRDGLRAVGAMTVQKSFEYLPGTSVAGVRFRPGMAPQFVQAPAAELTDASTLLEDLWGGRARELERRLNDARSIQEAMRIMLGSVPPPKQAPGPVERAVKAIESEHGNVDLDSVARQANLSTRQFRRRCLEASGLTPKHLCRVLRFRHAWRLAHSAGQPDWTRIAAEADYFDQAHMIHEFREFTGDTPMAVFSNTR